MTKSIKRLTASFLAAMLVLTTLCTSAFAAGTITSNVSGETGNLKISYSYSVDDESTKARTGFITTPTESLYTVRFTPASGESARICFYDWWTRTYLAGFTVPVNGGGMPSSFWTTVDLGKSSYVYVTIQSNSSTIASGRFTIEGVSLECEVRGI